MPFPFGILPNAESILPFPFGHLPKGTNNWLSLHPQMKIELQGHYGYRRLVRTMLPSIAMMIVTSVYSIVDGLFVSNFAGSTAFAAMNIVWPGLQLLAAVGLMIGTGGSALVSKTLGEGDRDKACRIFTMLTRLALVSGIVMAAVAFIFMRPLMVALGAEGEMSPLAVTYGRVVFVALPLFILQMMFQPFYMVAEKPEMGTAVSIACGVANIFFDALFVWVFKMGLLGAALGTAISLSVGGLFPLIWFLSRRNRTHLQFVGKVRNEWRHIGKSCSNGMSEYVGNVALSIVSICYNLQLMKYIGEDGVSAYGILMYMGFVFAAVFIGYNIGVSQIISYNYGAGNTAEMRSLLRKSLVLIALGGLILTGLAEATAVPVSRFFVGYDETLCSITVRALRIYMLSFLLCGFNMFTSAWFTALNNGVVSAVAAFARTLIFELGCVLVLPSFFGVDGIWSAVNVAEVCAFALSFILVAAFGRRYGYLPRG